MSWTKLFSFAEPSSAQPQPKRQAEKSPVDGYPEQSLGGLLQHYLPAKIHDIAPPSPHPDAMRRLRRNIDSMAPMPEIWHELSAALRNSDVSAGEIAAIVGKDSVLTARVLQSCNSPAYAPFGSNKINNLQLAIARLGLDETNNILFHALAPRIGNSPMQERQARILWLHSQAIAQAMRTLAEFDHHLSRHEANLIGMMHDIGKLVIVHSESTERLTLIREANADGISPLAAEWQSLGYTHIDAGMVLALHWQLPKQVQQFIAMHHQPWATAAKREAPLQPQMQLLNVAHLVVGHALEGLPDDAVWSVSDRHHRPQGETLLRRGLGIPLESQPLYEQMLRQVRMLKKHFPDLYPHSDSAEQKEQIG